jgi:hypothetical protein
MIVDFFLILIYMKETKGKTLIEIDHMYNENHNNHKILASNEDLKFKSE